MIGMMKKTLFGFFGFGFGLCFFGRGDKIQSDSVCHGDL